MNYREFFAQMDKGKIEKVYLFSGEEEYVKRQALERLRGKILPQGFEQLNESLLEGVDAQTIMDAAEKLPLMCERRLVVIRDWAPLLPGKAKNEAEETERMTGYLKRAPETCCMVFYMRKEMDGRKKMVQNLQKTAGWVAFEPLSDADLMNWVKKTLKPMGKQMDAQAVQALAFMAGRGLTRLELELKKLAAYAGESPEITQEDVEKLVSPSLECTIFQLVDRVIERNAYQAQRLLKHMREAGESPVGILAMITRQMRMMTFIKLLREQGLQLSEIEKKLELSHFVAGRAANQAQRFHTESLKDGYKACVEADYLIKSGQMRDSAALDLVMLKLNNLA